MRLGEGEKKRKITLKEERLRDILQKRIQDDRVGKLE